MGYSALVNPLAALRSRRSVILGYHGVGASSPTEDPHNLRVPPERFRAQVALLNDAGFRFVTVRELAERMDGGRPPPGLVALSFDDGMEDNYSVLLPMLQEWGIVATVYVTTGLIGQRNPWLTESSGARMMTEDELCELAEAGVELGAHTVSHPDLSILDREACLREMVDSREALERLTGYEVHTFAYPFCRYDDAAVAAAADAQFLAAVTCDGRGGWTPLELNRTMITGRDGLARFLLKVTDLYEPIFESTPGRFLHYATRGARGQLRARWPAGGRGSAGG